jgi:hypothetical protein
MAELVADEAARRRACKRADGLVRAHARAARPGLSGSRDPEAEAHSRNETQTRDEGFHGIDPYPAPIAENSSKILVRRAPARPLADEVAAGIVKKWFTRQAGERGR